MIDLVAKVLLQRLDALDTRLDRLIAQLDGVQDDVRHTQNLMPDGDAIEARLERIEARILELLGDSVAENDSSGDGDIHE